MSKNTNGGFLSNTMVPLGTVTAFLLSAENIPNGWLLCNKQPIDKSYPLYTYMKITPDLQGRTLIGSGTNAETGTDYKFGDHKGEEQHTLIEGEMPGHTHCSDNSNKTSQTPNNGNNVFIVGHAVSTDGNASGVNIMNTGLDSGGMWIPGGGVGTIYETDTTGNDQPHNNMQPYYVINYIIYAGEPQ